MAENANPFAGLLTPEVLSAQRRAEFDARYADANPWVRMAAEAGLATRERDIDRGIGATSDDLKAKRNQDIMTGVQTRVSTSIASGKMTAEEAQAEALEEAIREFAKNGEWEQALGLTQPLNAIKMQQLERSKIKAETANLEAKPELTAAQTQAKIAEIETKKVQAEASMERARAMMQSATDRATYQQGMLQLKELELYLKQLKLQEAEASGLDKGSATYLKEALKMDDRMLAASQATNLMSDITEEALKNPAALTQAGPLATTVAGLAASARAGMTLNDYDPDVMEENTKSQLVKLNISDSKTQAAILDLAFAFARVRDPGGRLSNQDVQMALEIVTGKGDPRSRLATLKANYERMVRDTDQYIETRKGRGFEVVNTAQQAYDEAKARYTSLGKKPAGKGAAPGGMTAAQRLEAAKAARGGQ